MKFRLSIIFGSVGLLLTLWLLSFWPAFVEYAYAREISPWLGRAFSAVTGVVPLSVAEILIVLAVLYVLVPFVIAVVRVVRKKRPLGAAAGTELRRLLTFASIVAVVFYLTWGLNYARRPLASRLDWAPIARPADEAAARALSEELARVARELVDETNTSYRAFAGKDDLERPSAWTTGRARDAVMDEAYRRVQSKLALDPGFAAARGPAKPVTASLLLSYFNLTGFYFPWTGEADYNRLAPPASLPHVIAHEKAHQRGMAREDEANFIGYLACVLSDDAYVRYSGALFAQRQLIGEIGRRDAATARALIARRSPGVQRDVDAIRAYWQQFEGVAANVSAAVNDRYLKAQGVPSGIASYAASQNLIVLYARHNGGSAVK